MFYVRFKNKDLYEGKTMQELKEALVRRGGLHHMEVEHFYYNDWDAGEDYDFGTKAISELAHSVDQMIRDIEPAIGSAADDN